MINLSKNTLIGISIVLSYLLSLCTFKFFHITFPCSELIFLLTMFAIAILIQKLYKLLSNKNMIISAAIFSVLLSTSFVIGRKIQMWDKPYFDYFKFSDVIYLILISLLLFIITMNALNFICKRSVTTNSKKTSYKFWIFIFLMLIISWLPYFLIYYPGNLSPDSFATISQCIGITPYNNHHPIAFTMFANIFIQLGLLIGDLNFSVACFSFAQILVMAGILSYSVYWLKQKGLPSYVHILTSIFFAINPVIAMYSITMWKDVMFSGWVLLLTLYLYDVMESNGKKLKSLKGLFSLVVLCILVSFGRNNGFYVVIALLFTLAIYFRTYYKLLVPTFLVLILAISVVQGPVYKALGIKQGGFAESVGMPLQQIGYTLEQNGNVNHEQKEFLNNLLPVETIANNYRPNCADYIKFDTNFNNEFLNDNKSDFLKTWASMLPSNFSKYMKAWLMQTLGYYHIGTTNWVIFDSIDANNKGTNDLGIVSNNFVSNFIHADLKSPLHNLFENIKTFPLIENLFSIAFMVWLTFFSCIIMFLRKRCKYIISLLPLLAIWGTMMIASPTFCEFRYMFSFHLALPFIILMIFIKNQTSKETEYEQNERIFNEK